MHTGSKERWIDTPSGGYYRAGEELRVMRMRMSTEGEESLSGAPGDLLDLGWYGSRDGHVTEWDEWVSAEPPTISARHTEIARLTLHVVGKRVRETTHGRTRSRIAWRRWEARYFGRVFRGTCISQVDAGRKALAAWKEIRVEAWREAWRQGVLFLVWEDGWRPFCVSAFPNETRDALPTGYYAEVPLQDGTPRAKGRPWYVERHAFGYTGTSSPRRLVGENWRAMHSMIYPPPDLTVLAAS